MATLSYSYGKDSGACIHVILDILKWPLDRIVTADVWATDTIPAVLPEMWEWQNKADEIIKQRYGITVEHVCARNKDGTKRTYEQMFYHTPKRRSQSVQVERERERAGVGFPRRGINWCNNLKKLPSEQSVRTEWVPSPETPVVQQQSEEGCFTPPEIRGFPLLKPWCNSDLKVRPQQEIKGFPGTISTSWCKDLKRRLENQGIPSCAGELLQATQGENQPFQIAPMSAARYKCSLNISE